ncbi:hypothetical protein Taro_009750 [Colocasia esculenta]|uniref:G-patch domain-containing protein n=1 Tax=Colocasia esculenta TaxID=4460 RepID=A0A843U5S5_COLES|nr:hypothetical protein [Colocasia esculenta]
MLADKLPSALAMVTRGPAIIFAEGELASPEARRLPLCITLVINHVAVGAALVDTGASINVCPLSTLRACDLSEGMLRPTPTTIAAYDNSRRSCHGMVTVQAELGPLAVTVDFYVLDIDPMFRAILGRPWLEALGAVLSTAHQCLKFPFQGRIIKVKSIATTHSVDALHDTHLPAVWPANKPIISVLDINYPWSYTFQSQREVNLARVNAVKRKEPLSTKGWQIMMKLGYEEGKGLRAELQGIVKPIPDIVTKSRWGLGYRERSKPWSSSTSTLKADREPLTWTLWCHFIRGPTQPRYNTVVVEAELSQHEVHGRNFSRHMAPLLTYRALEALRPTRRRKTGDSEAEWYRCLVPSSPPLLIQLTPQLLTAAHSLLTPELPPAVLSALQADPGDHEVTLSCCMLSSDLQKKTSTFKCTLRSRSRHTSCTLLIRGTPRLGFPLLLLH